MSFIAHFGGFIVRRFKTFNSRGEYKVVPIDAPHYAEIEERAQKLSAQGEHITMISKNHTGSAGLEYYEAEFQKMPTVKQLMRREQTGRT